MYQEQHSAWPARLAGDMRPEPGDVIIRCMDGPPAAYAVGVTAGPAQMLLGGYDEAGQRHV